MFGVLSMWREDQDQRERLGEGRGCVYILSEIG